MRTRVTKGLCVVAAAAALTSAWAAISSATAGDQPSAAPGECASRFSEAPTGSAKRTNEMLVPLRDVVAVLACRYQGGQLPPNADSQSPGELVGERKLEGRDAVIPVAEMLDDLALSHPLDTLHCPIDIGGKIYLVFSYRTGSKVLVRAKLSGCRVVTSPQARRAYLLSGKAQRRLEHLTR